MKKLKIFGLLGTLTLAIMGFATANVVEKNNTLLQTKADSTFQDHLFYFIGTVGGGSWDAEHAISLGSERKISFDLEIKAGEGFDFAYFSGGGIEQSSRGIRVLDKSCNAFNYFSAPSSSPYSSNFSHNRQDCFCCLIDGKYNINYDFSRSPECIISLLSEPTAEHLVLNLNAYSENVEPGSCLKEERFPKMKSFYDGLNGTEQEKFRNFGTSDNENFKKAYDRFVTWASYNNVDPWTGETINKSLKQVAISTSDNNTFVLIASLILITSLAGLLFLKIRRKDIE